MASPTNWTQLSEVQQLLQDTGDVTVEDVQTLGKYRTVGSNFQLLKEIEFFRCQEH